MHCIDSGKRERFELQKIGFLKETHLISHFVGFDYKVFTFDPV